MRLARVLAFVALLGAVVAPSALALRFTDRSYQVPSGVAYRPYNHLFGGDGGCGPTLPYQFSVVNGTLPPGLTMRKEGLLTGTPTQAGSWSFWIELSDQDPPSAPWCSPRRSEREFTVRVEPPPTSVGAAYAAGLGTAGEGSKTWSIAAGRLPAGLTLSPAGAITGTPVVVGSFPLQLAAHDGQGRTTTIALTIVVRPKLVVATSRLAVGRVGRSYRARVRIQGGAGPATFDVVSGRFPTGVRLDRSSGTLSGTPRRAGVYPITVRVSDSLGAAATKAFVLTIDRLRG